MMKRLLILSDLEAFSNYSYKSFAFVSPYLFINAPNSPVQRFLALWSNSRNVLAAKAKQLSYG